ncbi:MAG: TRAP transporter large permease subunit [Pseudomonadales bacterium]|jgi:tripartite ATP-independent transporter DctM subunit|nr:TRAP transporter large permease subunit [Pseudomonadales bacterium]
MLEFVPLLMFGAVFVLLLAGYPVALTLGGTALLFAFGGIAAGVFDAGDIGFLSGRIYGTITNQTLIAVPLFVLMGVILEKSRVAERLLDSFSLIFGRLPGGLGLSVTFVGMLMAASTGIVGATVVTMGLMSLPTMLKHGYDARLATGTIAATGTLGQIIPPSIALVLLGDVLSSAYQQAQLNMGIFSPDTVSVGDLFAGALIPGLVLVVLYMLWVGAVALARPDAAPNVPFEKLAEGREVHVGRELLAGLVPPLLLIVAVLGSIMGGVATPTEASGVGALGAAILALAQRQLDIARLREIVESTTRTTAMVFFILIGAALFSLVFRGYGGDELVQEVFEGMPGGVVGATIIVMAVIFFLGFILDFIEITFVVVPIVGPVLLAMGLDPVWLGVMIAVNLQTSFLTPPFGFALFYLRGVAPPEVRTTDIYRGVVPFILIQLFLLGVLAFVPELATWLPDRLYG